LKFCKISWYFSMLRVGRIPRFSIYRSMTTENIRRQQKYGKYCIAGAIAISSGFGYWVHYSQTSEDKGRRDSFAKRYPGIWKFKFFVKNPKFSPKSKFFSKIQNLLENPKSSRKSKTFPKIQNFLENPILHTGQNPFGSFTFLKWNFFSKFLF